MVALRRTAIVSMNAAPLYVRTTTEDTRINRARIDIITIKVPQTLYDSTVRVIRVFVAVTVVVYAVVTVPVRLRLFW